jgi:hypothetical protein
MLIEESRWIKKMLQNNLPDGGLVLNIGSSTEYFISVVQPHIKENVYNTIAAKSAKILNVDIKHSEGVDLVGDVTQPHFLTELISLKPDVVICSNLLEHITDRPIFCKALEQLTQGHTKLIVTVPYSYPYHPDPIDTLFRPTPKELALSFPQLLLSEGIIISGGPFVRLKEIAPHALKSAWIVIKTIPAYALALLLSDKNKLARMQWVFKRVSATCCLFKPR